MSQVTDARFCLVLYKEYSPLDTYAARAFASISPALQREPALRLQFQCHAGIVSPTAAQQNAQRNFGHFLSFFSWPSKLLAGFSTLYEAETQW